MNGNGLPATVALRVDPNKPLFECEGIATAFDADAPGGDSSRAEKTDRELTERYGCRFSAGHELRLRDGLAVPLCRHEVVSEDFGERRAIVSLYRTSNRRGSPLRGGGLVPGQ